MANVLDAAPFTGDASASDTALDATSNSSGTGYVEFLGTCPDIGGFFIGGWVSNSPYVRGRSQKAVANFSSMVKHEHVDTIFYSRDDVAGEGVGFVMFFRGDTTQLRDFLSMRFGGSRTVASIYPTANLLFHSQSELIFHLKCIQNRVQDRVAYEKFYIVVFGRAAIDFIIKFDGFIVIEGWLLGTAADLNIRSAINADFQHNSVFFPRPDVSQGFSIEEAKALGFIIFIKEDNVASSFILDYGLTPSILTIALPDEPNTESDAERFILRHFLRLGFILQTCLSSRSWVTLILKNAPRIPDGHPEVRGHIEESKGIDKLGGHLIGWTVSMPLWELFVLSADGTSRPMLHSSRWNREDVNESFSRYFGSYTQNSGFLIALNAPIQINDFVYLIALKENEVYIIASSTWGIAPLDPVSYARWAFDFPIPSIGLVNRFSLHDSIIIDELVTRKNRAATSVSPKILSFGEEVKNPRCTIVIPLYARFDFMQHQLLEFSDDRLLSSEVDIIYVVDDPRIMDNVAEFSSLLQRSFGVSFRVILGIVNRGFSGATNLGVLHARSQNILLLNSDVIPEGPGWLDIMLKALEDDPNVGVVGARLLHCNASLQHDGMMFHWEPSWGAFLNKHPGAGFSPKPASPVPVSCTAVTAACALTRRSIFDAVGGLDESFLIGDFEDSDFCLKVSELDMQVVCVQNVQLVHLERQSFSGLGTDKFREQVARYNAHKHQKRWGSKIAEQMIHKKVST